MVRGRTVNGERGTVNGERGTDVETSYYGVSYRMPLSSSQPQPKTIVIKTHKLKNFRTQKLTLSFFPLSFLNHNYRSHRFIRLNLCNLCNLWFNFSSPSLLLPPQLLTTHHAMKLTFQTMKCKQHDMISIFQTMKDCCSR